MEVGCITCQGFPEAKREAMRTLRMRTKKIFLCFSIGCKVSPESLAETDIHILSEESLLSLPLFSPLLFVMPVSIHFPLQAIGAPRLLKLNHISGDS